MVKKDFPISSKGNQTKVKAVIVAGFGGSGSSAVVDLLKEMDTFELINTELRIISDPDGLICLEDALVHNWTPYKADIAIKRFNKLIYNLNSKYRVPYLGVNHKNVFKGEFLSISKKYIEELLSFEYKGYWFGIQDFNYFFGVVIKKFLKIDRMKLKPIYVSFPQEEFINITRKYLENLMALIQTEKNNFIVDEGYLSLNAIRGLNYFNNGKMIIIDRDPRDIYLNAIKYRYIFVPGDVQKYIKWYEYLHIQSNKCGNDPDRILRIHFEDLIYNYSRTVSRILNFLNIEEKNHTYKLKYFNPEISKQNVKLWERSDNNKSEINKIYNELKPYCYI